MSIEACMGPRWLNEVCNSAIRIPEKGYSPLKSLDRGKIVSVGGWPPPGRSDGLLISFRK